MKKKVLAAMLALTMALTLLPGTNPAVAADEKANYAYTVQKNGVGENLRLKNPAVVFFDNPVTWGKPSSETISLTFKNTGDRVLDLFFYGEMLTCFDVTWGSSADAHVTIPVGGSAVLTIAPKVDIPVDYDDTLLLMETNSRIGWSLRVDLTTTSKAVTVSPHNIIKEYGQTLTSDKIISTITDGVALADLGVLFVSEGFDASAAARDLPYPIALDMSNVSSNYHVTLGEDGGVTVVKATPEPVSVNATGVITGSALSQSLLTGQYRNPHTGDIVEGVLSWVNGQETMSKTGNMTYTFTPSDTTNYHTVTGKVEVNVSAKTPTDIVAVEDSLRVTYDGQPHQARFTVTPAERAAQLKVEYRPHDSDGDWTDAISGGVGVYDVRATVAESDQYAAGSASALLTIAPKPIKFYLPTRGVEQALVKNKSYDGNTVGTVDTAYFDANNDLESLFVPGDDVRFNYDAITAAFDGPGLGMHTVTVTIDGANALLGNHAGNYQVADTVVTSRSLIYTLPSSGGSRGGGSSSGSAPDKTPAQETVSAPDAAPAQDPSSAALVAPAVTADSTGEAKAAIDAQVITDAVAGTVADKATDIVIAPQVEGDAGKVTVELPKSSLDHVAEQTDVGVTVQTGLGSVTISNAGLGELAGKSGETVAVSVEKVSGSRAVDITVQVGQTVVERMDSGLLVALPDLGQGNVLVALHSDGTEMVLKKSLVEDGVAAALLDGSCTVAVRDNSKAFSDIPTGAWYVDTVDFATSHELFSGTGEGRFSPDIPTTRGMLTTVLWSLEGEQSASAGPSFADVDDGAWYTQSVGWATANGIIQGYEDNSFRPGDSVTREQMAAMLYRYAQKMGLDTSPRGSLSAYADGGQISAWANEAMAWAVGTGLMTGRGDGVLSPTGSATRAEVAAMTQRLIALIVG